MMLMDASFGMDMETFAVWLLIAEPSDSAIDSHHFQDALATVEMDGFEGLIGGDDGDDGLAI